MADIELVIKIPEEEYRWIKKSDNSNFADVAEKKCMLHAIKNGTPLPKGHGDLKDSNNLKHAFITWSMAVHGNFTDADIASIIYNSPTIIEADKEVEG